MERQAIKTFRQLSISFFSDYYADTHSPVTVNANSRHVQHHVLPVFGRKDPNKITNEDVARFVDRMRESGLSEKSMRTVYGVARQIFDYGKEIGVLKDNPLRHYDPALQTEGKLPPLSGDDLERVRAALPACRLGNLFGLIMATGIGRAQALGLFWDDVDMDGGVLHVRRQYISELGNLLLREEKMELAVPLSEQAASYLLREQGAQDARRDLAGEKWRGADPFVFTDDEGFPIRPDRASTEMNALQRRLGIPGLTLSSLKGAYMHQLGL